MTDKKIYLVCRKKKKNIMPIKPTIKKAKIKKLSSQLKMELSWKP